MHLIRAIAKESRQEKNQVSTFDIIQKKTGALHKAKEYFLQKKKLTLTKKGLNEQLNYQNGMLSLNQLFG